ncbi:MAG: crossover junction endodeoxyribonuclease RuvC [Elusimicrobia bacterium]|nr:crossover junction endodeoxyribonuclease RuvC [Elusimicrobiota bacterium]
MNGSILGIDPGVSETGWALLNADCSGALKLGACGLITTPAHRELPERLRDIHRSLSLVFREHQPDSVAIEEMFFLKAAHTIRGTLQARGVILLAAAEARRPISEYNPRTVKLTLTGSGSAGKPQMQRALQKSLGLADILRPDDVADAAAIAVCHWRSSRMRRLKVLDSFGGGR